MQAVKATPHNNSGKGVTLVPSTVKLLHRKKERKKSMKTKRVAGLACNRLLMRVDNSTGKGTSSMDKFSSKVHRVHMELGDKVRLHRYICLWRASERKLGKKPVTKPKKTLEKSREQG